MSNSLRYHFLLDVSIEKSFDINDHVIIKFLILFAGKILHSQRSDLILIIMKFLVYICMYIRSSMLIRLST